MLNRIVTVLGGTGSQGGGVVNALLATGNFSVRVASRNPDSDAARGLIARGVEVVKADLLEPSSLRPALEGSRGAFSCPHEAALISTTLLRMMCRCVPM